jgi:hypothetical protein
VTSGPAAPTATDDEILSLAGLGVFEGRCPVAARSWTLRFIGAPPFDEATDTFVYQVGHGPRRTVEVNHQVTIPLVPRAVKTHEPADTYAPPIGQGRGLAAATSVPTTAHLRALIYQGTEPATLRADVDLALANNDDNPGLCVLVGSTIKAYEYPNG